MDYAQISSIVFFAAVFSGIGSGLRALLRLPEEEVVQETVLGFLFGIAAFIPITLLVGVLHIPIHWLTYLTIAIMGATYRAFFTWNSPGQAVRAKKRDKWYDTIDWHLIIVIILAITLAAVMYKGATTYPYLEDDDPWVHAEGASYVAEKLTFWQTPGQVFTRYIAPYTPFYTTMMGTLAQISHDIPWTLKFFKPFHMGSDVRHNHVFHSVPRSCESQRGQTMVVVGHHRCVRYVHIESARDSVRRVILRHVLGRDGAISHR